MTRRNLTRLFIKVFGVLLLVGALIDLPSSLYRLALAMQAWETARVAYTLSDVVMAGVGHLASNAGYLILGLGLLWWNGRLADRTGQPPDDGDLLVASSDFRNLELSLVTVIGLYFVVAGLADLCGWILRRGMNYGLTFPPTLTSFWTRMVQGMSLWEIPWIAQAVVKLTIGARLVLGPGSALATIHRARQWVRKWRAWPYEPV